MIHYAENITKEEISELETERFSGRIIMIDTEEDCDKAVYYLSMFDEVGFDTETRPCFEKRKRYKVSLVQISTDDVCFLFRLDMIGMPSSLMCFLMNNKIMKIGLSLRDDIRALNQRTEIEPMNFLELQEYVKPFGIQAASLQKIYAIVFNKKISKRQRLTNWAAKTLTDQQQKYAALDAWACLRIYDQLKQDNYELLQSLSQAEKGRVAAALSSVGVFRSNPEH